MTAEGPTEGSSGAARAAASEGRRSWLARWRWPLQIGCALLVLAWVVRMIPWSDVALASAGGAKHEVAGEFVGEWKADRVRFVPADPAALPAPFAALALDGSGSFELARPAADAPQDAVRFDWRPGMLRVFREVDPRGLALALSLFAVGQLIVATRWWRLLSGAGLRVPWFEALRLTCLGLFFNQAVPGLTGGDLVKAVLAARAHPDRKSQAVVSIVFDRLLGLLCMVLLAAGAVVATGDTFAAIRTPVIAAALCGVAGGIALLSRGLRRALGFEWLLARLPLGGALKKLDEAVTIYATVPGELALCVVLSFLNHMTVIGGILVLGRAFGDDVLAASSYFAVAPVATIVSALPIAPGGWGLGEAVYSSLFAMLGASAAVGLATSISFRLLQMAISLAAGLFLFAPGSARLSEMKELSRTSA